MHACTVPTLILHGARDKLTPFEHGVSYFNQIGDTPKEVLAVNGPNGFVDGWLKAHMLGLTMPEKMGYEYTHRDELSG